MHILQQKIISRLIHRSGARFAELKPEGLESNHYVYHLKSLIREGLVKKSGNLYQLTAKGKQLVDKLSLQDFRERIQPKIVTMVACKNNRGEFLLYRRARQPFLGTVGFPYGKIHLGETILEAANRELKEKTGLSAKLKHRGEVYLTVYENGDLVSQILCHVFSGAQSAGKLVGQSSGGECFWSKLSGLKKSELIPGFLEIVKLLEKHSPGQLFFGEYVFKLKA